MREFNKRINVSPYRLFLYINFRIIQLISTLIPNNLVEIKFRITGYSGLFLNCNITNLLIDINNIY